MAIRSWLAVFLLTFGVGFGAIYCFQLAQDTGTPEPAVPADPVAATREREVGFDPVKGNVPEGPVSEWPSYLRGPIEIRLPGTLKRDEYQPAVGSHVLMSQFGTQATSFCVMPATASTLLDDELRVGKRLVYSAGTFADMFPIVRKAEVKFQWMHNDKVQGIAFQEPVPHGPIWIEGRVWRLPKACAVAHLLTMAPNAADARALADKVQAALIEKSAPAFPPDRPASGLKPNIPEDWLLAIEDRKKKYWVSPDGHAFIMVSNPSPAPFLHSVPNYGTSADMASNALLVLEKLSGREAKVGKCELIFEPRLWILLSRGRGSVKYKAGDYIVEMDRWVDPRTEGYQRVYIGGLTQEDFEAARKIRDSLVFVWK